MRMDGWVRAVVVCCFVAAGALMMGVSPSAAQDVAFTDPANDTYNPFNGFPMSECHADVRTYGARYTVPSITLWTTTTCGFDPHTSPNWGNPWHSGIGWDLDTTGDGTADYQAYLYRPGGGTLAVEVRQNGSLICGGTPRWNGSNGFFATFAAGCIGTPPSFAFELHQQWDDMPGTGVTNSPMDTAPDIGMTPLVHRSHLPLPVGDGPGAASAEPDEVDVFVRGQDDSLWTRHRDGNTWANWTALGGVITSTPAAASSASGQLHVFVRGQDNALWTRHFNGTQWGAWRSLNGLLSTAPAAVSAAPGTLDIFVRGQDNALWTRHLNGTVWGAWQSLGGTITATPAAASASAGGIAVFARGSDGGLWTRTYDGAWSSWSTLGGTITTAPSATSHGGGTLEVFARGADNALWNRRFDGSWGGWTSLGGVVVSPAAAVSASPGTVDLFVRGQDTALWANHDDGAGFDGWFTLGGSIR